MTSTMTVPEKKYLRAFRLSQVWNDRVETYLQKGWSLGICCKACERLVEWTPPDLQARFGGEPDLRIAVIAQRLKCSGEGGCGSKDIAVFPHPYDEAWTWPPASSAE
jgi:hypothetical protein